MGSSRGRVDHGAFGHLGDLLLAVLGAIMQLEVALDGIHHLVARINVELTAVFAAASHEYKRVSVLPENVDALARRAELAGSIRQADDWHFRHGFELLALASVCGEIGIDRKPEPDPAASASWGNASQCCNRRA